MIIIAGRHHRHRALVPRSESLVNLLMEPRSVSERERPEKGRGDENRNKRASVIC